MDSNSSLLCSGYEAWNRDDLDGWLELLDSDVRIETSGLFPDLAPEYVGHARAAKFWRQMHEPWKEFRIDIEHVQDEGEEWAVASIRFRARGADSGVKVDMRFGMAMRAQHGLATELVNRRTFDEARTAVQAAAPKSVERR